jgi:hypothetical protein
MINEDITNEDITNEDITNEDITNEDITNEDITNEDITNEDITWIKKYKEENNKYKDFYKEKVVSVKLYFVYINSDKYIRKISNSLFYLENTGIINKDNIISLIKQKQIYNNKKYKLHFLYKFNIDIDTEEIEHFVKDSNSPNSPNMYSNKFFKLESYVNDIEFKDTINIFQDLNAMYFIFHEVNNISNLKYINYEQTRKNKKNNNNKNNKNNKTIIQTRRKY